MVMGGLVSQVLQPKDSSADRSRDHITRPRKHYQRDNIRHRARSRGRDEVAPEPEPVKPPTSPAEMAAKKRRDLQKRHREKLRSLQWAYLRYHCPKEELPAVGKKFKFWDKNFGQIQFRTLPRDCPWRTDGEWLYELEGIANMRRAWGELDVKAREEKWPKVMLSTLKSCPDKAIQVLEATLDPLPPGYAINDVLRLSLETLEPSKITNLRERNAKTEEFLEVFSKVIEDLPKGHVPLKQSTLGVLCRKLSEEQVAELYQILCKTNFRLHRHTRLHIASSFAASLSRKEMAFEILKGIADEGVDLNQSHYSSVITTLLQTPHVGEVGTRSESAFSPQQALQYFIERGFSPNVINITSLLQSLCRQGDVAEAVRLPLLLAESGVQLDARCAATVFRGAKESLKEENIKGAFNVAKAAQVPYTDVLNNALHSVFYFAEMESREQRFRRPWGAPLFVPLLRIYAKKFDLEPLQWLLPDTLPLVLAQEESDNLEKFSANQSRDWRFKRTIVPVVDEFFSSGPSDKLPPTSTTLAIMLRAYIRSLSQPYDLMSFYAFFKSRLEEQETRSRGVEFFKEQASLIHDTLILTMCESRELLRPALQVFGDMLRSSLSQKAGEGDQGSATTRESSQIHPPPSVFTFSIVLHGLLLRGEKEMAEQVFRVMQENDIEPNIITWNTLAKGYAIMQNIPRTVRTFQELETVGFKPDAFTFKAFSKLKDQTQALKMMDRIIEKNKRRMELEQHSR